MLNKKIEYLKSKIKKSKHTDDILISKEDIEEIIIELEKLNDKKSLRVETEECLDVEIDMIISEIEKNKDNLHVDQIDYMLSLLKRSSKNLKDKDSPAHIFNEDECGKDEIYCMMYICPNCGQDNVLEYDKFCSECGSKLIWEL